MSSSNKLFGILAIVAFVCFAALIALQVAEWSYYRAEPSLWPAATR